MPIRALKIDRCFVTNVPTSADDMKPVRSIIAMGHNLDLAVVAEGVEVEQQLEFLRETGCDQVQGYLLSRPLTATQFEEFLARMHTRT